jgi:TFIIF-interacting CTD phosphatase-like protein
MAFQNLFYPPYPHNTQVENASSWISTRPSYIAVSRFDYSVHLSSFSSLLQSIQQADYVVPVEIEYNWHNVYVIKRPGVDNFLKKMGEIYEVVVFTASLSKVCSYLSETYSPLTRPLPLKYADPVLDKLDIHQVVSHRLFRESCYNHKGNYVKVGRRY